MSTTTQILFNSPALHSLKRDQLVKLCKIHAIKASGKNVDLIDRLKKHATTLPRDTPLSVAMRSEDMGDNDGVEGREAGVLSETHNAATIGHHDVAGQMPRPSEQWEVVMESIQEVDESSSQGTLSSGRTLSSGNSHTTGEFGTGSSKVSSVSSSLKAFATSLGLKRNTTSSSKSKPTLPPTSEMPPNLHLPSNSAIPTDELTQKSVPYSSLPETDPSALPKTDHFTLADSEPIPGHTLRPGVPAPSNARLSTGTTATPGATTTIRLVSASYVQRTEHPSTPNLRPFATAFDLVIGSPFAGAPMDVWPKDDRTTNIYPALPTPSPLVHVTTQNGDDVEKPGGLTFPPATPAIPEQVVSASPPRTPNPISQQPSPAPPTAPFIFGSPHPQHRLSNQQFRNAAASVLEEMNKRLAEQGLEPLTLDLLNRTGLDGNAMGAGASSNVLTVAGSDRFDKVHEREFSKMDSIATHYAARRAALDVGGQGGKKRKSSLLLGKKNRPSGTRVISGGRRKMAVPGAFGDDADNDEESDENRRLSKKPRVEGEQQEIEVREKAKRISIVPHPAKDDDGLQEEEKKRMKEKEAIRRKLDKNKARRRSSMGRVSVGGGKAPLVPQKKGIASRFGFLSSAKSMVQSVWNRGVASSVSVKPTVPAPASTAASASKRTTKPPRAMAPPPPKPAAPISTRSSNIGSKGPSLMGRVASTSGRLLKPTTAAGTVTSTSTAGSSRSRSPIPSSFKQPPSVAGSTRSSVSTGSKAGSGIGTAGSRAALGFGFRSKVGSRNGSIAGASSIGTRSSSVSAARSRVSSLGTRGSLASIASGDVENAEGTTKREVGKMGSGVKRVSSLSSSRLLAPTASSLARAPNQVGGRTAAPAGRSGITQGQRKESTSGLESVAEDYSVAALEPITNHPNAPGRQPRSPPRPGGRIFSKPLVSRSGIVPATTGENAPPAGAGASISAMTNTKSAGDRPVGLKPKALPGRKPRISRSRVIARLASQRATSGSGSGDGGPEGVGGTSVTGRTRSSLGAAKRRSFAGAKGARGSDVIMSAKKRARQSEYARRKSRPGAPNTAMDIDN